LSKIKVLQLIDGGFLGGGQANVLSIARNLDKEQFEVCVAAAGEGSFETKVLSSGIPFIPLELPKLLRSRYLKILQKVYDGEKFDIIHTHGGVAGFYGRTLKKHNPLIKCVHTIHGLHYIHSHNLFRKNISRTIEQYLVQYTDVTICETYNDYLAAIRNRIAGRANTQVIPNAIDISRFSNLKRNPELMGSLGLSPGDFICGNISRFDEQKNQKLILQAAYFLVKKYPNMKFVFVGDGKYLKQMRDLTRESNIEANVIFTGEQKNLADYYSIFDIFIFPTLWEGMPYVLLEAMASRLAIICSAIPNLLEVIKPNFSALTIDPLDMDDLFQKVSSLYQDTALREKIAQNAMIESTQYDESEVIPKIAAVYEEVTQK